MSRLLQQGDRIRLKVRTLSGWKGTATVLRHDPHHDLVEFLPDGDEWRAELAREFDISGCYACRHEVALIRGKREAGSGERGDRIAKNCQLFSSR